MDYKKKTLFYNNFQDKLFLFKIEHNGYINDKILLITM